MRLTPSINTDSESRHAENLSKLTAARTAEKTARRLRRDGRSAEAIEAFEGARDLYVDSGLAFHEHGESELADQVKRAIERCRQIATNIRYPKAKRAAAITPRPDCLACGKSLRRYSRDGQTFDDGTPQEWGDYGDNRFCGLTCGWRWACRHAPIPQRAPMPKRKP